MATELYPLAVKFSNRFGNVSTKYPNMVAGAYGRLDLARALANDPYTVATKVARWERAQGHEPRDWAAIGRQEGHAGIDRGAGVNRPPDHPEDEPRLLRDSSKGSPIPGA
jgi:hypothetical protein